MKYIFRNIIAFIKDDTLVFFMTIITVAISSFIINLSYGVYQNYEIKKESVGEEQKHIFLYTDYEFERQIMHPAGQYKFLDYDGEAVTIAMVREFGKELGPDVWKHITSASVNANYYNYEMIEIFSFDEDGFTISPLHLSNSALFVVSGRYFTEEEFKNGEKVALVFDETVNNGQLPISQEMEYSDTHIKIGDELYKIIGCHCSLLDIPLIPITALPDDTIIDNIIDIQFDKSVDLYIYNQVCKAASKAFGDMVTVEPVELPDIDTIRLYNTIIIIAVIISAIAAINFAILYRYILKKRCKQVSYMRMCGLKYRQAIILYLGESIMLTMPVYIITTIVFAKNLLPWFSDMYQYGFSTYNNVVYIALFGIYFVISLVVLSITLHCSVKKNRIIS